MVSFEMNGTVWEVQYLDPNDTRLIDRTGDFKLGVTDPVANRIYLNVEITPNTLVWTRVIRHELSHCVLLSYDLLGTLHKYVKKRYWRLAEEELCNFIADYSEFINDLTAYLALNTP